MRRRFPFFFVAASALTTAAVVVIACSAPEAPRSTPLDTREDDGGKSNNNNNNNNNGDDDTIKPEQDPPLPDGGAPPGAVYAHTATKLYLFEPISKTLSFVGDFACLEPGDRMLDIALDRDGVMFGTSDRGFLSITATTGACQYVKEDPAAQYPNSLSFVPKDTVETDKETLVGYQFDPAIANQATVYAKIDLTTGAITKVGDLNDPNAAIKYKSSGDLIAVSRGGNKAFLTVRNINPDAGTGNDLLAEVDPKTGKLIRIINDTKNVNLYGLGFWAGTSYGFAGNGDVMEIDTVSATPTSKKIMTLMEDGGVGSWFGAGVKTLAPTAPTTN